MSLPLVDALRHCERHASILTHEYPEYPEYPKGAERQALALAAAQLTQRLPSIQERLANP